MFGVFLIIKSIKIRQRNFFVFTSALTLIGAFSAEANVAYWFEIMKEISNLPKIKDTEIDCFPPINS